MRRSLILVISVCLNLALGAIYLHSRRHSATAHAPEPATIVITNQGKTHVVIRKQYFAWQELESADYAAYVANLREIGCPEQTIRDIVIADVNQLYTKRILEEVPTADQQWWRTTPDTNFLAAASVKTRELDQERRTLLATLLGPDWETALSPQRPLLQLNGPVLGELSAETKNAVQGIIARSQERTQEYLDAQKAAGRATDPAELARIAQQTRTELAQVLTAAQMEEFLLRYSDSATALRAQLRGVELTPDEFRNLFRAADPIEQQLQLAAGDAPDKISQQTALATQLGDLFKSVLGSDRYRAYQLAQDPLYAAAVAAGDQAGASPQAVQKLYALNKLIADEQARIRNNPSLTDDQKTAQLKALDQQQQQASDQILGLAPAEPPLPPMPAPPAPGPVHAYAPGETIDQIAAMYGVTPAAILNANPDVNFNGLTRGAAIKIPRQ
jgi:LysM repeat protein